LQSTKHEPMRSTRTPPMGRTRTRARFPKNTDDGLTSGHGGTPPGISTE